jgi:hypothetical protein
MPTGGKLKMSTEAQENGSPALHSEFVNRVSSLPTVEAVLGVAVSSYNKLKEASPGPIKTALEVGEKTTNLALASSQPILTKLSAPIQYVDSLACVGLDKVEERVPGVKNAPEKIYSDVKDFGYEKVNSVKEYGSAKLLEYGFGMVTPEKIAEYKEQLVSYAATGLAAAEGALDQHMEHSGQQVPIMNGGEGIRTRVEHVTAKARLCVQHHATSNFVAAQKYASDGIGRVLEALQVIRGLTSGKSAQEVAKELKFDWLSKLLEEAKDQPTTQQALFVALAAAREAQEALTLKGDEIKSKVHDAYTRVTALAGELTSSLNAANAANLTTQILTRLQEQALHLQELVMQLTGLNLKQHLPELQPPADGEVKEDKKDN